MVSWDTGRSLDLCSLSFEPSGDLLGRPTALELGDYNLPQAAIQRQFAGLWAQRRLPGAFVGFRRPIEFGPGIARDLAADRRRRAAEGGARWPGWIGRRRDLAKSPRAQPAKAPTATASAAAVECRPPAPEPCRPRYGRDRTSGQFRASISHAAIDPTSDPVARLSSRCGVDTSSASLQYRNGERSCRCPPWSESQ